MKPVSEDARRILEGAPRPINDNDPAWKELSSYFSEVLSSQPEGFHEFRVIVKRDNDGSVFLYLPTLTEIKQDASVSPVPV